MQKSYLRKSNIVYEYKKNLYLNITNRCPVKCLYCIKYKWKWMFRSHYLKLDKEPTYDQIINELKKHNLKNYNEIIFCGYGEPLMRYHLVKKIASWIKKNCPTAKIRINTNGLAEAYWGKNISKELNKIIDSVSVSVNAHNEKVYRSLHNTKIKKPLHKIIKFIKNCKKHISNITITTIDNPKININYIKQLSKNLGIKFRKRKFLNKYEPW